MAGLCCVKILLLWAGVTLANSDPAPLSTAGPPVTRPPLCSYTVTPIDFGLQITITSSPPGNYIIKINEGGQHETEETFNVELFNQPTSRDIKHLKPCTEYEHNVTFNNGTGQTPCSSITEQKTRTSRMSQSDITDVSNPASCIPGYVCYQSEWDISSSMSTSDDIPAESCTSDSKTFCIKPGFNDICSDLTTTFTSGLFCSSFSLTKSITVDFLNQSEIHSRVQPELPAKIEITLPSKCHLTTDYTCKENGQIEELSKLEPFTDYSCIGHVKDITNVTIINTTDIPFRIDCDLEIIDMKKRATDTSIHLSWNTTSTNCQAVLQNLSNLYYDCSCSRADNKQKRVTGFVINKNPEEGTCYIKELQPYTDYTCEVQPKYNDNPVGESAEVRQITETGIPDGVTSLLLSNPEKSVIKVTCVHRGHFNGPDGRYIACLYASGDPQKLLKKETKDKCDFEFKDLSYSTTYRVEVTAFNGKYESFPAIEHDDRIYKTNRLAFVVRLCFFTIGIIIIIITVVVIYQISALKRRKSRNDVNEDVKLESTAIYVNERPPGLRS